jgi:hypothetical protein
VHGGDRLALAPGRVVLASQLIDAVWDEDPPAGATYAPGPPTPGPRSASTRRRPPARSSAAGSAATCLGLRLGGLTAEEVLAVERPAMTYVRAQPSNRLQRQLARAYQRWRHPTSGHLSGDRFR